MVPSHSWFILMTGLRSALSSPKLRALEQPLSTILSVAVALGKQCRRLWTSSVTTCHISLDKVCCKILPDSRRQRHVNLPLPWGEMGIFGEHPGNPVLGIMIIVNPPPQKKNPLRIMHKIAKRRKTHFKSSVAGGSTRKWKTIKHLQRWSEG